MGIDFFNLLQPPVKKVPQPDIIQVIPASPSDTADTPPAPADAAFQAILDRITGRPATIPPAAPQAQKQGGAVTASQVLAAPGGNNLFDFFSEAGFIYIVGAILVGVAFVILRK